MAAAASVTVIFPNRAKTTTVSVMSCDVGSTSLIPIGVTDAKKSIPPESARERRDTTTAAADIRRPPNIRLFKFPPLSTSASATIADDNVLPAVLISLLLVYNIFSPVACFTAPDTNAPSMGIPTAAAKADRSPVPAALDVAASNVAGPTRIATTAAGADNTCVLAINPTLGSELVEEDLLSVGLGLTLGVCDDVDVILAVETALLLAEELDVAVRERD